MRWASRPLKVRVSARQAHDNRERSSQITKVARGRRRSKVAWEKLPSLIHSSPACASRTSFRKAGRSLSSQWGCQMASRQITGMPARSANSLAKVVLPLPAQPKTTIRMIRRSHDFLGPNWKATLIVFIFSRGPRDQFLELQPARKSRISSPGRNGIATGVVAASAILRLICSNSGFDQPTLVTSISPSRATQKVVGTLVRP
jgi:hypothetical protein